MNFVTVAELNNDIVNGMNILPKDIDIVVGIPRSGMLVATLVALYLNKPLTDIDSFKDGKMYTSGSTKNLSQTVKQYDEIKKALIVEDSSSSGASIKEAKEKLVNISSINKVFLAAYVTRDAMKNVDLYFRQVEQPRIFEWNFMHHKNLINACVDIDGVLCIDPTDEENDDGSKYVDFIYNAKPRYVPTRKIGWIVTSRLEKYRTETEAWLHTNGIEYNHLIMMNLATAEERRKLGNHGRFKAEIYKNIKDATWFIESDEKQAKEISNMTGKPVFCVNAQYFYKGNIKYRVKKYLRHKVGRGCRKVVSFIRTQIWKEKKWKN